MLPRVHVRKALLAVRSLTLASETSPGRRGRQARGDRVDDARPRQLPVTDQKLQSQSSPFFKELSRDATQKQF